MKSDDSALLLFVFIFMFTFGFMGYLLGSNSERFRMEKEAIERGYGELYLDADSRDGRRLRNERWILGFYCRCFTYWLIML